VIQIAISCEPKPLRASEHGGKIPFYRATYPPDRKLCVLENGCFKNDVLPLTMA
jgi:hypothetical protein